MGKLIFSDKYVAQDDTSGIYTARGYVESKNRVKYEKNESSTKGIWLGVYCNKKQAWSGSVNVTKRKYNKNQEPVIANLVKIIGRNFNDYMYLKDKSAESPNSYDSSSLSTNKSNRRERY